jgi:hypothetical protein
MHGCSILPQGWEINTQCTMAKPWKMQQTRREKRKKEATNRARKETRHAKGPGGKVSKKGKEGRSKGGVSSHQPARQRSYKTGPSPSVWMLLTRRHHFFEVSGPPNFSGSQILNGPQAKQNLCGSGLNRLAKSDYQAQDTDENNPA